MATPQENGIDFLVRAYNPVTGDVLWEDRVDHGDFDAASAVVIDGNRVFVAGTGATANNRDLIVRTYDASTGRLLWEVVRPNTSAGGLGAGFGMVFVSSVEGFIAALKASSGELIWSDTDSAGPWVDIAVQAGRVVAVGGNGHGGLKVAAYNAKTGVVEWQDTTTPAPDFEQLIAVDASSKAAYVAGSRNNVDSRFYSEVMVRAYDLKSGLLLLDDRSHRGSLESLAQDIAVSGKRVFVVGGADSAPGGSDFLVRAYDAKAIEK